MAIGRLPGTAIFGDNGRLPESRGCQARHTGFSTMRHAPDASATTEKPSLLMCRRIGALAVLAVAAALLSGCETDGSSPGPLAELAAYNGKKDDAKPPEPPMTRTRAAMECWMQTEKGRADASLDKRADFVTKCIDDKLKTAQAAPKT
jgi:hypothetical protein